MLGKLEASCSGQTIHVADKVTALWMCYAHYTMIKLANLLYGSPVRDD